MTGCLFNQHEVRDLRFATWSMSSTESSSLLSSSSDHVISRRLAGEIVDSITQYDLQASMEDEPGNKKQKKGRRNALSP